MYKRQVFAEVMGNPNSSLLDIEKTAEAAHAHGIPLIIDSTFTPPNLIRPIEHGADIVVHSLTKFIGGDVYKRQILWYRLFQRKDRNILS